MKRLLLAGIALICTGVSFSQNDQGWKYAKTITQQGLKAQLSIIASAEMEGRETGTEGQRKAAAYIESQFKALGLKSPSTLKGYQQHYPLYSDSLIPGKLKIGNDWLVYGKDYLLQPGTSNEDHLNSSDIVFAGYGISDSAYNDYASRDVKGKIIVILNGEPKEGDNYLVSGTNQPSRWGFSLNMKASKAKELGAKGIIYVNTTMGSISPMLAESSLRGNLTFPHVSDKEKLTVISLLSSRLKDIFGEADANKILKDVKEKEPLNTLNISSKTDMALSYKRIRKESGASNVIGYIEGSDKKDEYVFLTGHYDHLGKKGDVIYYGADDDGSGTVTVIEMAQAFAKAKKEGRGPRRTVVFMTVSGEEKGLWGSEYYSDHPVFPLDKTTVDLNTDMIGRIDPNRNYGDSTNYIYVIGNDKLSSDLDPISKAVNEKFTKLELDYKFNDPKDPERIYYRSDHYNFARKGVPIIFYFDGIHKDYHKPTDTVDKINFDIMEKRARYIFLTAWDIANRDNMLVRDIPLPSEVR
ncbi:MAG: M28 family peptidase [Bacteroidetes bacterium]|nr:M28 family peptidase [Bacteroidota bacterium]